MKSYEVYESNSGGLYLVVYGENGEPEYFHGDYEQCDGMLSGDISDLKSGNSDPAKEWEYNWLEWSDGKDILKFIFDHPNEFVLIACRYAVYPDRMGAAGKREFFELG